MADKGLKKSLSTFQLVLYGTGTIIGAGIYMLVGKVSGVAGYLSPFSFLLAAIVALFSGLSYAQLAAAFPKSAGEVVYADKAFSLKPLSIAIGWMLLITGSTTAATLVKGFSGYLQVLVDVPELAVVALLLLLLGGIAIAGISESVWLVSAITLIEVGGLLFIIFLFRSEVNLEWLSKLPERPISNGDASAVVLGAFLAFFAFIGFEDLANVAEEAKKPKVSMPVAVIGSIFISTLLYFGIAVICVNVLPLDTLSESDAPLAALLAVKGDQYANFISIISMIAVINGALVQIIMVSRVLYGMAVNKLAPQYLAKVNPRFRTPVNATLTIMGVLFLLSIGFGLVGLAESASFIILIVFCTVNLSLIRLRKRNLLPQGTLQLPLLFTWIGLIFSFAMLVYKVVDLVM